VTVVAKGGGVVGFPDFFVWWWLGLVLLGRASRLSDV